MGSEPPEESIRMSDQNTPEEICTEATALIAMLSSVLPNNRGLIRLTRNGPTTIRVGKKKFPFVKRLALNTSSVERDEAAVSGMIDAPFERSPYYRLIVAWAMICIKPERTHRA